MLEVVLAFGLAGLSFWCEKLIKRKADSLDEGQSVMFLLKWNGVRIFGLLCAVVSVILWAEIRVIVFIFTFIVLYISGLIYRAIRYGTT